MKPLLLPFVLEGQNMNSRGREPTVSEKKQIRPRRGRTIHYTHNRGFHPRLFVFGPFAASFARREALNQSPC